jgi:HAD superfamily hydrolase (TIGR01509 family)
MAARYGLIFDVDGVIADTERVNAEASIKVFADLFSVQGVVRSDFEAGLGRGAAEYVRAAARVHAITLSNEEVIAATEARQRTFLQMLKAERLPAFPGVLELMESAMGRDDFGVGIATSSTREKSEAVLVSAAVPYAQMVYVTGSDVKNRKPHPELFLKAAEKLELDPGRCIVIEDAPDGIAAAHAAGCRCVGVTNSASRDKLIKADLVVGSLEQVDIYRLMDLIEE